MFTAKNLWIVMIILLIGALGYILGYASVKQIKTAGDSPPIQKPPSFSFQSGTIQGQITKVQDNLLTVQDQTGHSEQLPAAADLIVATHPTGSKSASPSAGTKNIELNKLGQILLINRNNQFQVKTIVY